MSLEDTLCLSMKGNFYKMLKLTPYVWMYGIPPFRYNTIADLIPCIYFITVSLSIFSTTLVIKNFLRFNDTLTTISHEFSPKVK